MRGLVTVKIGLVAAASLAMNAIGWAWAMIAQSDAIASGSPDTIVSATALTGTAGALVYVVRQMASGKLVHRDPATAEQQLSKALEKMTAVAESGQRREDMLHRILVAKSGIDHRGDRG